MQMILEENEMGLNPYHQQVLQIKGRAVSPWDSVEGAQEWRTVVQVKREIRAIMFLGTLGKQVNECEWACVGLSRGNH